MTRPMSQQPAVNIQKPPLIVSHVSLERWDPEGSPYKVECPECKQGLLLVRRLAEGLSRLDRCVGCGQAFWYDDDTIAGESLVEPAVPPESAIPA